MNHVLIVDDEPHVAAALQRTLRRHFGKRLQVRACTDPLAAVAHAADTPYDLVIADLRMPAMDGLTMLLRLAALQPLAVRMILSASADFQTAQRAVNQAGIFRYLSKPWDDDELVGHIEAALGHAQTLQRQHIAVRAWEKQRVQPSAQELERERLESMEPGITRVNWGPNGEVLMSGWVALAEDPPGKPPGRPKFS
jgi:two-component system probable response regulator PhcQ